MAAMNISNFRIICISIFCGVCFGLECYKNKNIDDNNPSVITNTGIVVGKYIKVLNKESAVFLGIPFAKPPLGEKRFQISEPIESWRGAYSANKHRPACMQYSTRKGFDWIPSGLNVSEDCLHLNIWLPPNCCCNRRFKIPVMVWIHGGGYSQGSSSMDLYDGSVLASHGEVIVVSMNYRLGIFGFLNAGTKAASGNMGLHDQFLALQWIRDNIRHFGGDPNNISLFGESAGALAITLLMVSPLTRNLFHKAILESGTSNQPVLVENMATSVIKTNEFSKIIGCSKDIIDLKNNPDQVVQCLKNKSADELAKVEDIFTSKFPAFFIPSYGNECDGCLKFFVESPIKTIESGKFAQIPTLLGNNQHEGSIFLVYSRPDIFKVDAKPLITTSNAKNVLESMLKPMQIPTGEIFDYYVNNFMNRSGDVVGVMGDILGDFMFKCPNMYFADKAKEAYFYRFNHRSSKESKHEWMGATHFDEVAFVFGKPLTDTVKYTEEDRKFSEELMSIFTSFASHSYPQGAKNKWPLYSSSQRLVYELHLKSNGSMQLPDIKVCDYWKTFLEQK